MFNLGYLLQQAVYVFAMIIRLLLIVRIVMSWFTRSRGGFGIGGGVVAFVFALTEPIIGPLRVLLQKSPVSGVSSFVDFSPLFAFFMVDALSLMLISLVGLIG